jgi:hypothetical protein
MSSNDHVLARSAPPSHRAVLSLLALVGALVPAAVLAATVQGPLPLAAVPAVTFGVPLMTAPALYVALTMLGDGLSMMAVVAALGRGLLALALVQLGLAVPLGFLAMTATPATALGLVTAALALACAVAAIAVDAALSPPRDEPMPVARLVVLWTWIATTVVIAARLYGDVVAGVTS